MDVHVRKKILARLESPIIEHIYEEKMTEFDHFSNCTHLYGIYVSI